MNTNELDKLTTKELIDYIQGRKDIKVCGYLEDTELTRERMKQNYFTDEAIEYYLDLNLSYLIEDKTWGELLEDAGFEEETGHSMYNAYYQKVFEEAIANHLNEAKKGWNLV